MENLEEEIVAKRWEKAREYIYGAYLFSQVINSTNPEKRRIIQRMRELTEELKFLFARLSEGS